MTRDVADIVAMAQERGEFWTGDDGFVCYWPRGTGYYTSHMLRALADELDRRNAAWEAQITADLAGDDNG